MYVCVCNAVTDSDIRTAVDGGVHNLKQLGRETGCGSSCGCCKEMAIDVLEQAMSENLEAQYLFPTLQLA